METTDVKTAEAVPAKLNKVPAKLKEIRKEIADKLHHALADHKIVLGAEKLGKHVKKISKFLAEEIVKATHKKAKKSGGKQKKKGAKKK
jgi:hypothetical protein